MSRGPSAFKKSDVTRAVEAVRAAGVEVASVRFGNGGFSIITGKLPDANGGTDRNEWDELLDGAPQTAVR